MAEVCLLCEETITNDRALVYAQGLEGLIRASKEREDGLDILLEGKRPCASTGIPVHKTCRKKYTLPSDIKKSKRQKTDAPGDDPCVSTVTRSQYRSFNIKTDCLYCAETCDINQDKSPSEYKHRIHETMTTQTLNTIREKAIDRNDEWGDTVKLRIATEYDLIAAEGKYHHNCQVKFYTSNPMHQNSTTPGRPSDSVKQQAFDKLCKHLRDNDECQYTLVELESLMDDYLDGAERYATNYLHKKLVNHFKDEIVCSSEVGKPTIYTFLDASNQILRENYRKSDMSKESIISMAAGLIRDDIRSKAYTNSQYPDMTNLQNAGDLVPDSLKQFMSGIVKSKSETPSVMDRRHTSIAHSIISACRPRSFVSPLLLAVSVYINKKYESRELVDILSSLGFADDYREVQRLYSSLLSTEELYDFPGDLTNFMFDNADINVRTLTGHDTWHVMGGVASSTPARKEVVQQTIPRETRCVAEHDVRVGRFMTVPIKICKKRKPPALQSIKVGPLFTRRYPSLLTRSKRLDDLWLSSYAFYPERGLYRQPDNDYRLNYPADKVVLWSGFMQHVYMVDETKEKCHIQILPFINKEPHNDDTVYSALCFAQALAAKHDRGHCSVTFDQPLYKIAVEIHTAHSRELNLLFVRLGGFHTLMSYMGSIGYLMEGSGITELWETVYAPNTVIHMMTGRAYSRALRSHQLTSLALVSKLLDDDETLTNDDIIHLKEVQADLWRGIINPQEASDDERLKNVSDKLESIINNAADNHGRTAKLWIEYLKQLCVLRLFIRAEKLGDFELHLYAISMMIPLFKSSGHFPYEKSARVYLDQMRNLHDILTEEEYDTYANKGMFTVRRSEKHWSGVFTDQVIEQDEMRILKVSGGLAHGRGLTDSVMDKWVHAMPRTIPICSALEEFTGVHTHTSDQHVDLRDSSSARDFKDYQTYRTWFDSHSPFAYGQCENLVNIANGRVSDNANAEQAFEIGSRLAQAYEGIPHSDVKCKRSDVVKNMKTQDKVILRGEHVQVNSVILLLRTTVVIEDKREMEEHLKYEFSNDAPALFDGGLMRRTNKSSLADLLKSRVGVHSSLPDQSLFVLDGGNLLHTVPWPDGGTYTGLCETYVTYVKTHYGNSAIVIFDGYGSATSTKIAEQDRRATRDMSADILFEPDWNLTAKKSSFLNNGKNKDRFIKMLVTELRRNSIDAIQCIADADRTIAQTALTTASDTLCDVVVIGNDTDLLVILVALAESDMKLHMLLSRNPVQLYTISEIQSEFSKVLPHLLLLHAYTGCDTVSAIYGMGKKSALTLVERETNEWDCLNVFKDRDCNHADIERIGERFLLRLYGAPSSVATLDQHRYIQYLRSVKRASLSSPSFKLESIPPTSSAAKFHSYRAYHTVQQWLGINHQPTLWGWRYVSGKLVPHITDKAPASEKVLKMISCNCKKGCAKRCKCHKSGLKCSKLCKNCKGDCQNGPDIDLTE